MTLKVKEIEEGHFRYFFEGKEMTSLEVLKCTVG